MEKEKQHLKREVQKYFDSSKHKALKSSEINEMLNDGNISSLLPPYFNDAKFIEYLIKEYQINKIRLPFPNRPEIRYTINKVSIYNLLMTLNISSYFSHLSALHFNRLIHTEPKEIYINTEQYKKQNNAANINQKNINRSFQNKPRISNNHFMYNEYKIVGLNGMNTNNLGVIEPETYRFTDVERTLIDIVVRPQYSGGLKNIISAYKAAKNKIDLELMNKYLKKLKYTYPYNQAIGFCLEVTGYPESSYSVFYKKNMRFKFYLLNHMESPLYSEKWKLYYPRDIIF